MELWELVARESIRDLVARYNANGDSGRFEAMMKVFADDAVVELVATDGAVRRFEGVPAIASIFADTKAGWDVDVKPKAANHHVRHCTALHGDAPDRPGR
jgi:ketosteroid isomerase-like protein